MALPLSYNLRNLVVRKLSSGLTFAVVAVVVLVLTVLLSFAAGIRASLAVSGSRDNLLVLKRGATAESTSIITTDEYKRVDQAPGIARDAGGSPLLSRELCVQTSIPRRAGDQGLANVAVRGVDAEAFTVHAGIKMVEGRVFDPGQLEVVVGKAARDRYQNLELGGELPLGRSASQVYKVVGVFDAAGGALESEVWGPRTMIADSYKRDFVSSVVLRVENPDMARAAIEYLNGPAVQLDAKLETEYYRELSSKSAEIAMLTSVLVGIMAIGAAFAVANTMYAAVDGRRREIAMLRTIGFSRASIIVSFMVESLALTLAACAAGLAASLLFSGYRQDFLSDATWTVLAFELRMSAEVFGSALGVALLVGVLGSLAPALRASRVRVIEALRKA